jgi:glycosyltransferase involved in cell wall biosynthesis
MKIGYDAKRLFCNHRGLGNYSRDLIRIMSTYYPENTYHLYTPKISIDVNIDRKNTSVFTPDGIFSFLPRSLWRSYGITPAVKQNGDNIYHGLSQELPAGIEKTGIKSVITFHDAIFVRYPELYDSAYRKIFTLKNQKACKVADKIIAISEQSKQDAIRFFGADENKIDVIYQGCNNIFREKQSAQTIDKVRQKYRLPKEYLLYVGAIEPRKNIAKIVEAIAICHIDFPLVVIGRETAYSKTLNDICQQYKVADKVLFLTDVPTTDLPMLYQSATTFVYPSVFEGFGIPLLEALVSNIPVISSKGSCFEESGGKFSKYIDPKNAGELGAAILQVLNDADLRQFMKREGLKHAAKFTDDKIAFKLNSFYQNLL